MSLAILQSKIGVTPDGIFGPNTLKAAKDYFGLTNYQAAHFFGQCWHETGGFKRLEENLNYSASGLMRVWPSRFNAAEAEKYAGKPEAIANKVYANRMGNGGEESGDGWFWRGRGALQLTGRDGYTRFSQSGFKYAEVLDDPDLVATKYAFESAGWFFDRNGIWALCNKGMTDAVIEDVTRKINGGTHGLKERSEATRRFYKWAS